MSHLDDGAIHALLDGELPPAEAAAAREHLAACPGCAARLEQARLFAGESDRLISAIEPPSAAASPASSASPAPPGASEWRAAERLAGASPRVRGALGRGRNLGLAASVLLAVAVGYGATRMGSGAVFVAHEGEASAGRAPQAAAPPVPQTAPPTSNAPIRAPRVERAEPFAKPAPAAGNLREDALPERAEARANAAAPAPDVARDDTSPRAATGEAKVRTMPSAQAASASALADSAAAAPAPADLGQLTQRLGERPRQIEGLALVSGAVVPGSTVAGADPAREVLRLAFRDSAGRIVTLEQQRADAAPEPAPGAARRSSSDAPRPDGSAAEPSAATRAEPPRDGRTDEAARGEMTMRRSPADAAPVTSGWWRDGALRLRLLAPLPGDSLDALRRRVR
jgi:hypothetical protein